MELECRGKLNGLKNSTTDLDRATARVSKVWNDRVSESIDAQYVNRIVGCCSRAITDLEGHVGQADRLYQRLYSLGRS